MNRQTDIDKKVNKALESLEGIQRAELTPYFFTRVKARLQREEKSGWEITSAWLARPGIAIAGLLLILSLNAFLLFEKDTTTTVEPSANYTSQNTEEEYVLTASTNTSYDYENIEP
ncbi:MAG: hypothetical protein WDO71_02740 [Bacteroidota bacterium]